MRVLCNSNDASKLTPNRFESGYTKSTEFDLTISKEYSVYGIFLSGCSLSYLVIGEGMNPHWYPAELFTVTKTNLPANWHFQTYEREEGFQINAIWGYDELVNSDEHFDGLSNLDRNSVAVFMKRMREANDGNDASLN